MTACNHEEHRDEWWIDRKYYHRSNPDDSTLPQQFKTVAEYTCICGAVAKEEIEEDWHSN